MRATMNTIYTRVQTNLNKITNDMSKITDQISSGLQMSKISDSPVNLVSALRYRSSIVELDQYTENIQNGNTIINSAETALTQMKDIALRAKTLAIAATDPANSSANRDAIASEVKNLIDQTVDLANTQINGKYIFGGFRTTGYTDQEPTPFIIDKGDGYWINGTAPKAISSAPLTGTVAPPDPLGSIKNGDLLINGTSIGAVPMPAAYAATDFGMNMGGAAAIHTAINGQTPTTGVTASYTTLYAGGPVTQGTTGAPDNVFSFDLNGIPVTVTSANGGAGGNVALDTVNKINAVKGQTGVMAVVGNGANGGAPGTVVFRNVQSGDESAITVQNFTSVLGNADPGFGPANFSQLPDATHNTGDITLSSARSFTLTSPNAGDDSILGVLGLDGGNRGVGFQDVPGDGTLVYGYPLTAGELTINGIATPTPTSDGHSDVYSDASADAKASAINEIEPQTGVTAVVTPAHVETFGAITGGIEAERLTGTVTNNTILGNSLAINGTSIATDINNPPGVISDGLNTGMAFSARAAINQESPATGVSARLTTLYAGGVSTAGYTQTLSFDLNNVPVSVITGGVSAAATTADIVKAINDVSQQSGVQAVVGNGTNGGAVNSIVLSNVIHGDETDIKVANLNAGETTLSGLTNGTYSIDATHNTGEISLESDSAFTITSPGSPDDSLLKQLGLSSVDNSGQISYGSTPNLKEGDLTINGIPIITTAITGKDDNNTLLAAINNQSSRTGVKATRDQDGILQLTAVDGRNIHVETSANGEAITHLTAGLNDQVTFGSLQLRSDRKFILKTVDPTVNPNEPGLTALGLAGGADVSGEPDDVASDGQIDVFSIHNQPGSVRYAGDRINDLEIKIGSTSTMTVGKNGKTGIMDTTIFSTLQNLLDSLRGNNFTAVTGIHNATTSGTPPFGITAPLNSKATGLEPESLEPTQDLFAKGTFTVTVTDHDYDPPKPNTVIINVDPAVDTLESVSKRIGGIPNISASWTKDGQLKVESNNPDRYTFRLSSDSSNFLEATGVSFDSMQSQAINQSIGDLDTLRENLTRQVSDFGARANRIDIQSQIYSDMSIATKGNLSEVQDTDMIEAAMSLQAKQTAYQAALAAAAKTMQLSLVDYLK